MLSLWTKRIVGLLFVCFCFVYACQPVATPEEKFDEHLRTDASVKGEQQTKPERMDESSDKENPQDGGEPQEKDLSDGVARELPPLPGFLARKDPRDFRIVSYNVEKNSVFIENSLAQKSFIRLMRALRADVWALQEVSSRTSDVIAFFNKILPQPAGKTWHSAYGGSTTTISRYPIAKHHYQTTPSSGRKVGLSLIDLPDDIYPRDIYVLNNHFTCCGGVDNEAKRQQEADQLVNWMRIARTDGGAITLPKSTPMIILGDLNLVGGPKPLQTILTGDIINEDIYGTDSPPDWDKTDLSDAKPLHNGVGPEIYTWRWDGSGYPKSRIDFILYTDSVLTIANKFVLNTTTLSPEFLKSAGLESLDVGKSTTPTGGYVFDHLPVVVDFRLRSTP